ncbi:ROK family transcriptional regulator [Carboxylicivirga mesophila]|uniref:ROK family transcriptional regulator n=1 Tax=Carboxylicivirga mesophila TaxID=1166478 RepID=A0ABS5KCA8_9BACT|nr:ROK family transcriptional regulator [Carboxylicivirga mesophila]MBS2212684.1 ROK family transcriptional regulator [Carboxylicivirga mesophila]
MKSDHPKGSAEYINRLNKIKVLNLIRESGEISRAEIVKKTGLSAPTITRIVDSLIKTEQLAEQIGIGESKGGRPPMIVRFKGEDSYVIGIDWGRTHIYGILSDLNGNTLFAQDIKTNQTDGFESDLKLVSKITEKLIFKSGIDKRKLRGIGVAAAGFVNNKTDVIEYSPNFNWENVDIRKPLAELFQVPVIVDNVSRVMARGELMYGVGDKFKDFVFINIGYGIGSGIIHKGQAFFGFEGIAGEIGHTRIHSDAAAGLICACGKLDCLECYASGRGISSLAENKLKYYPHSSLNGLSELSTQHIAEEAKKGDELALYLFNQAADYLGMSIAAVANLLNPQVIVLGGKVSNAGSFFTERVRSVFQREVIQQSSRRIEIVQSKLSNEAAVIGAVSLILNEVLNLRE